LSCKKDEIVKRKDDEFGLERRKKQSREEQRG